MSDQSDEDLIESQIAKRGPGPVGAARKITVDISDDESDYGAPRAYSSTVKRETPSRSPSPRRDEKLEDEFDRPADDPDDDRARDSPPRRRSPTPPRRPPRPLDSYERVAVAAPRADATVNVVHFPPSISFGPAVSTGRMSAAPQGALPIMYRLRRGAPAGKTPADVIADHLRAADDKAAADAPEGTAPAPADPLTLLDLLESNARLVTWSDGSQTIAIGDQHCLVIGDVVASQQMLFRRGEKVQTFEAHVAKVGRVQPSQRHDARAKQSSVAAASAAMAERAGARRAVGRTMLRCTDEAAADRQDANARVEVQRRERERARLEARQRQAKERYVRPNRGLSAEVLESDEDSGDDRGGRSDHADRLMRFKRPQTHARPTELAVKRRKVGARRVVSSDEDSDSE